MYLLKEELENDDVAMLEEARQNYEREGMSEAAVGALAESLYRNRRYTEVEALLKDYETACPAFTPAFEEYVKGLEAALQARRREQEYGVYNFENVRSALRELPSYRLVHEDYLGGAEVRWVDDDKGRGLVATKDIPNNRLILAEKALEAFTMNATKAEYRRILEQDRYPSQATLQRMVPNVLLAKLYVRQEADKELRRKLSVLHHGQPNTELIKEGATSPVQKQQKSSKGFAQRAIGYRGLVGELRKVPHGEPLEYARIAKIVKRNAIPIASMESQASRAAGVWYAASLINHGCVPNAKLFCHGDMLFVKAIQNIRAGEEVTVNYLAGTPPCGPLKSWQLLKQQHGFACHCDVCKKLRRDPDGLRVRAYAQQQLDAGKALTDEVERQLRRTGYYLNFSLLDHLGKKAKREDLEPAERVALLEECYMVAQTNVVPVAAAYAWQLQEHYRQAGDREQYTVWKALVEPWSEMNKPECSC